MTKDDQRTLDIFKNRSVLLIGDTIVDVYVYGHAIGKSAETPTIVAKKLETKHSLGGAFLVARNLLELGAIVHFVTLIGNDEEGDLVRQFEHPNLKKWLLQDPLRTTTSKQRFWVDGYKLLQFDALDNRPLDPALQDEAFRYFALACEECDRVVISDYRHGFLPRDLGARIVEHCRERSKPLYVDSQVSQSQSNHTDYAGASTFCLNLKEAQCVDPGFHPKADSMACAALAGKLRTQNLIVKLGEEGAMAYLDGKVFRSPAIQVRPVDTCGAGDAFLSALCLSDLDDPSSTLATANAWAGLSTEVSGAQPPSIEALRSWLGR